MTKFNYEPDNLYNSENICILCDDDIVKKATDFNDAFVLNWERMHIDYDSSNVMIIHQNNLDGYCAKDIIASFEQRVYDSECYDVTVINPVAFDPAVVVEKAGYIPIVYVIGLVLNQEQFDFLASKSEILIWIDQHESSKSVVIKDEYAGHVHKLIHSTRGISNAALCWIHCYFANIALLNCEHAMQMQIRNNEIAIAINAPRVLYEISSYSALIKGDPTPGFVAGIESSALYKKETQKIWKGIIHLAMMQITGATFNLDKYDAKYEKYDKLLEKFIKKGNKIIKEQSE